MQNFAHNAPHLPKPGKRVRFVSDSGLSRADADFFSPASPPNLPIPTILSTTSDSPTLSTPSLSPPSPGFDTVLPQVSPASSEAPLTPSPARTHIELPQSKEPNAIDQAPNAILAAGAPSKLKWDISLPPGNASMNNSALSTVALEYSATLSHSETLTLMVTSLPGMAIPVLPSSHTTPYVSVIDVLAAVYRFFRQPLTELELAQFNPTWREAIEKAYRARYKRFSNHTKVYEDEKAKGPKKIDLLLGRIQWVGIRPAAEQGFWDLVLS